MSGAQNGSGSSMKLKSENCKIEHREEVRPPFDTSFLLNHSSLDFPQCSLVKGLEAIVVSLPENLPVFEFIKLCEISLHLPACRNIADRYCKRSCPNSLNDYRVVKRIRFDDLVFFLL